MYTYVTDMYLDYRMFENVANIYSKRKECVNFEITTVASKTMV